MVKKTRSHKHPVKQRSPKPKPSNIFSRRRGLSVQVIAGVVAFALLAGGSLAQWRATTAPRFPDKTVASTASLPELPARPASAVVDELPPEPPMIEPPMVYPTTAGYNAYTSGGLPPGALPAGVMLPGMMNPTMPNHNAAYPMGMMPMMQGGRTTAQGYGVYDGVRQQFTGKERDTETGLDYFGARYYSSTQGRFTSVDPENAGADPSNPQSWNGYSYALNNPLKYQDPDGRKVMVCDAGGKNCHEISDAEANYGLFNKDYIRSIGYTVKNNKIYDEQGNLAGTYRRTSFDDWSDFQNGVFFGNRNSVGLVDQAPAAGRTALVVAGTGAAIGTGIGGAMYMAGGTGLTTLGLTGAATEGTSTAATVAPQAASAIGNAIKGFTKHGINQAISRDGVGVSSRAILDALKNPVKVAVQKGGAVKIIGKDATVIVNQAGKVITTWARNSAGTRIQP